LLYHIAAIVKQQQPTVLRRVVLMFEARQRGIHPFCITIDEQARDYLPHMYGDANYLLIDNIGKLPYRISEIYRSLTS